MEEYKLSNLNHRRQGKKNRGGKKQGEKNAMNRRQLPRY